MPEAPDPFQTPVRRLARAVRASFVRMPPGLHGLFFPLTGSIFINNDDPPARQLQALFHELIHDGLTREDVPHGEAEVHRSARAIVVALRARMTESP